jgi:hypothetical protein
MKTATQTHDIRYPIGEFHIRGSLTAGRRAAAIEEIAAAPQQLRQAVADLTDPQLDTPYRPGGWTVRQVVHHLPDSHLNGYVRLKLALTETTPAIQTYDEARWAELHDATAPIDISLDLLDALHTRWVSLFRALTHAAWGRRVRHPDLGEIRVDEILELYAWHGRHHIAHITTLRQREGW